MINRILIPDKDRVATCIVALGIFFSPHTLATEVMLDGELVSEISSAIMPPSVPDLWQFVITDMAPEGQAVKKDQVVLSLDGGELMKRIATKQGELKEKQSERDRLLLEQAEKSRLEKLSVEERRAARDKALEKARQPAHLIPSNEYKKLAIDKILAEQQYALAIKREHASAQQRRQEFAENRATLNLIESDLSNAMQAMQSLQIKAPRDGLMVHKAGWNGDKFEVGSQVWMGLAVAEIPDPSSIVVRASLDERDYLKVRVGMPVEVIVDSDSGAALPGILRELGRTVHSKSKQQPVPVVDAIISLGKSTEKLKPGQAVRVRLKLETNAAKKPPSANPAVSQSPALAK